MKKREDEHMDKRERESEEWKTEGGINGGKVQRWKERTCERNEE